MAKARLRPISAPILPPVIIRVAITSVYSVIAVWIPVTSVPTSSATVAIATFITDVSSVIRNWPEASVTSTGVPRCAPAAVTTRSRDGDLVGRRRPAAGLAVHLLHAHGQPL